MLDCGYALPEDTRDPHSHPWIAAKSRHGHALQFRWTAIDTPFAVVDSALGIDRDKGDGAREWYVPADVLVSPLATSKDIGVDDRRNALGIIRHGESLLMLHSRPSDPSVFCTTYIHRDVLGMSRLLPCSPDQQQLQVAAFNDTTETGLRSVIKQIVVASCISLFAIVADRQLWWYEYNQPEMAKNPKAIQQFVCGHDIVHAEWDQSGARRMAVFMNNDTVKILPLHLQVPVKSRVGVFIGDMLLLYSSSVKCFVQCKLPGLECNAVETDFVFGQVHLMAISHPSRGTQWLVAFASDTMVGIVDARYPCTPLVSWTIDGHFSTGGGIRHLVMTIVGAIEQVIVAGENGQLYTVQLSFRQIDGNHNVVCGMPEMLPSRHFDCHQLTLSTTPITGMAAFANVIYVSYADGRFITITPDTSDGANDQLDAWSVSVGPQVREYVPHRLLNYSALLPALKPTKLEKGMLRACAQRVFTIPKAYKGLLPECVANDRYLAREIRAPTDESTAVLACARKLGSSNWRQ